MKVFKNCTFCLKTVFHYAPLNAIVCFIGFFVPGFFTGLNILLVQNIVDSAVAYAKREGELSTLIMYGVLLVVMTTLWAALQRIAMYQRDIISVKLTKNMAPAIADRLMSLEFAAFEEQATHETLQKMTKEPEQKILDCFFRVMVVGTTTISLVFTMAVFFSISPWIGVGVIVIGIPMAVLGYYSAGRQVVITEEAADARRRIADLKGMLTNKHAMFEMKLFGADELFMDKWTYYGDKQEKLTIRENKKILIMNISSNLLSLVYIMFVVCMVAAGLLSGGLTLGQFTAALSGAVGVQDKLTGAVHHVSILIRLSMDMSFYMNFMDMEVRADIGEKSDLKYYDIAFENVSFRYPGTDREILKNVTFYVKEGERIAFVGENGAGKTTIIKLLCGLYEPTTGNVTIGGVPVRELSEKLRLKLLAVVFQDFGSFQMTLRENVAFGNLSAINYDEKLKRALLLAGAGELLDADEKGLDRNLGKLTMDGQDLSKGQWQRVAMARAFVSDAKYVILDEPTASLDPLAESKMYENFARIFDNRGTIMISHRLASAKMADRIFVLDGGRIIDSGSHDELMARKGLYHTMFTMQSSFYEDKERQVAGV